MLRVRRSCERGHADRGWLSSFHSFSFAGYYDPWHMGWGNLRVLNEDRIAPGSGFGMHPHRDMEILSYVVAGALTHEDSMGHVQTITAGEVQHMTAGTGIMHSEYNRARDGQVHFLQIWLLPSQRGLPPGYAQKRFSDAEKTNTLCLLASPDGAQGALQLQTDARLYACLLRPQAGQEVQLRHVLPAGRKAYVHLVEGVLEVSGHRLEAGDALLADQQAQLQLQGREPAHFLLFDLQGHPVCT